MKKLILILLVIAPILLAQEVKLVTYKEYKFEFKGSEFKRTISVDPTTKDTVGFAYELFNDNEIIMQFLRDTLNSQIKNIDIYAKHHSYNWIETEKLSLRKHNGTGWFYITSTRYANFGYEGMHEDYVFLDGTFDIMYVFTKLEKKHIRDFMRNFTAPDITIVIREEIK